MEKSRFSKQCGKFFSPQITKYFILLTGNILFWALILPRVKHPFCSWGKNAEVVHNLTRGLQEQNTATFWNGKGLRGKINTNTKIQLLVVLGVFSYSHGVCCSFMSYSFSGSSQTLNYWNFLQQHESASNNLAQLYFMDLFAKGVKPGVFLLLGKQGRHPLVKTSFFYPNFWQLGEQLLFECSKIVLIAILRVKCSGRSLWLHHVQPDIHMHRFFNPLP